MGVMKGVIVGVVVLGGIGYALGSSSGDDSSKDSPNSSHTSSSKADKEPATPEETLQQAVDDSDADHPKTTKTQKFLDVQFDVKDNLGAGAIQGSLAIDLFDMAERIVKADVPLNKVMFVGMFPLVDKYGNEKPGQVFSATFTMGTLAKIKYDNIDNTSMDLIQQLASGPVYLHPDLQD